MYLRLAMLRRQSRLRVPSLRHLWCLCQRARSKGWWMQVLWPLPLSCTSFCNMCCSLDACRGLRVGLRPPLWREGWWNGLHQRLCRPEECACHIELVCCDRGVLQRDMWARASPPQHLLVTSSDSEMGNRCMVVRNGESLLGAMHLRQASHLQGLVCKHGGRQSGDVRYNLCCAACCVVL